MRQITCCFTGHRQIESQHKPLLRECLQKEIVKLIEQGYRHFGVGGALGFDTEVSLTILELKKVYKHINLILVLPCKSQSKNWKPNDIAVYEEILKKCDKIRYTSENYFSGCMHKRNRHLVDHSSICISYLCKNTGGTAYTVDYALSNNLKVINIANLINGNEHTK